MPVEHPDPSAFKAWLREETLSSGFGLAGFAACEPFESEQEQLATWFREGRGTLLPYLNPTTLRDPRALWPQARTALVAFFPYARPEATPGAAPDSLKLSRYLWGLDYHMLLKPRLTRLLEAAQARWPGLQGRVCVDTAPLLERQLAMRAGLGWQGKHTLLIAGKSGSWGFLGVLLLSVDLPPDEPFGTVRGADLRRDSDGGPGEDKGSSAAPRWAREQAPMEPALAGESAGRAGGPPQLVLERCGACTACLEACPSGALEPFRLNPALCLTTYTIETEAEPPPAVAAALAASRWAAGCDACQEVCPWNRAPLWGDPALWGGPSPLHTRPAAELPRGVAQWRKLTGRTALRRVRDRHWRATLARILGT